jgi:hypothetical protein
MNCLKRSDEIMSEKNFRQKNLRVLVRHSHSGIRWTEETHWDDERAPLGILGLCRLAAVDHLAAEQKKTFLKIYKL